MGISFRPLSITSSLVRCRRVFAALVALAVEELVEAADALLAPVRLGVVRPTAPFPLANTYVELVNGSEDLFGVEPLSTGHSRLAHTRRFVCYTCIIELVLCSSSFDRFFDTTVNVLQGIKRGWWSRRCSWRYFNGQFHIGSGSFIHPCGDGIR